MAWTADQYKARFDSAQAKAERGATLDFVNSRPENKAAWAQVAAVWAFLWMAKKQMDKNSITPSATAQSYAAKAESFCGKAESDASATGREPQSVAWTQIASNYAYAFVELVKAEAP